MKTLVIQLDRTEDIGSIRDKITWGKASRVLLVWPVNYTVFDRRVDLVTIKRICTSQGSRLGIVCDDPAISIEAEELQIPVFDSVTRAMRKGWDRRRKIKMLSFLTSKPSEDVRIEELRTVPRNKKSAQSLSTTLRIVFLSAGILSVLALVLFVVPSAEVRVYPVGQAQEMTVEFNVDSLESGTSNPGVLHGRIVKTTVEGEATGQTSGTVPVADKKARGLISVTNRSAKDIELPAQTIMMNNLTPPIRFLSLQSTTVPADETIAGVEIEAIYGGESGNSPANTITRIDGELGLQLELTNPEPITGGTDRPIPSPSTEDIQALRSELKSRLEKNAQNKFTADLSSDDILLPSSIKSGELLSEKISPEIGEVSTTVKVAQKIEYTALIIRQTDLKNQAEALLSANRSMKDWKISSGIPIDVQILGQEYDRVNDTVLLKTQIKGQIIPSINTDTIRRTITGTNRDTAQAIIALQVLSERSAEIQTWPLWLPYLPWIESRITMITP
jgi:hypothetical protein